jgi:hypothetical protein
MHFENLRPEPISVCAIADIGWSEERAVFETLRVDFRIERLPSSKIARPGV